MPRGPLPQCPVDRCDHRRAPGYITCRMHWRRIPEATRHALVQAWAARQATIRDTPGNLVAHEAYMALRKMALSEAVR